MISAGCGDLCDDCYWIKNLWSKFHQNIYLFEVNLFLKKQYENYALWLVDLVGAHQAALYLITRPIFLLKQKCYGESNIPDADQLLLTLRTSGLRKFEM